VKSVHFAGLQELVSQIHGVYTILAPLPDTAFYEAQRAGVAKLQEVLSTQIGFQLQNAEFSVVP
jgi:hypothetical protein